MSPNRSLKTNRSQPRNLSQSLDQRSLNLSQNRSQSPNPNRVQNRNLSQSLDQRSLNLSQNRSQSPNQDPNRNPNLSQSLRNPSLNPVRNRSRLQNLSPNLRIQVFPLNLTGLKKILFAITSPKERNWTTWLMFYSVKVQERLSDWKTNTPSRKREVRNCRIQQAITGSYQA